MSQRKAKRNDDTVVIEMGGPGLDAFNSMFGYAPGTTTYTFTSGEVAKATAKTSKRTKAITATEVKQQLTGDKIKRLILKYLKHEKLPVLANTLKLYKPKVDPVKEGEMRQATVNFEVDVKDNGLIRNPHLNGYILSYIAGMKPGDDLSKSPIFIEWDVHGTMRYGEDEDIVDLVKTKK